MESGEYQERLEQLIAKHGHVCMICRRETDDLGWRWIMPPGHREATHLDATPLMCNDCIKKGAEAYPWWGGEYGDCIHIESIRDVATNIKECLRFMHKTFDEQVNVVIDDEGIDTRTAIGNLTREIMMGIDKFDDEYFS